MRPALKKSDFHYDLPSELIAQAPLASRSASRLLVVPPAPAAYVDAAFTDLPDLLVPGDLLVFNDTRVIPARLFGQKATGGRVEILIERLLGHDEARAQLGVSKSPKAGARIALDAGGEAEVLGRDDTERYQTVFAREVGAVAAPTAGLHFDDALLAALRARGIDFGHVTLHVGAGTFQPVRVEQLDQHVMHSEWLNVGADLVEKVRRTREAGGRVIGVGTTVVRALESAMRDAPDGTRQLQPFAGETRLFILPGYRITAVDALVTNFHLPESTLLMMISAFAGQDRVFDAYRHAIAQRYRFFSYGDAMLLWPRPDAGARP